MNSRLLLTTQIRLMLRLKRASRNISYLSRKSNRLLRMNNELGMRLENNLPCLKGDAMLFMGNLRSLDNSLNRPIVLDEMLRPNLPNFMNLTTNCLLKMDPYPWQRGSWRENCKLSKLTWMRC